MLQKIPSPSIASLTRKWWKESKISDQEEEHGSKAVMGSKIWKGMEQTGMGGPCKAFPIYLLGNLRERRAQSSSLTGQCQGSYSSCTLPCRDKMPKNHLRERKGRHSDGNDASVNSLGKPEALYAHNYELFGRSQCRALQHRTGWGRKVFHGHWWSLPASSASLSLTLDLSIPKPFCAVPIESTGHSWQWTDFLSFPSVSLIHSVPGGTFSNFGGCKIKALCNSLNQSAESLQWVLGGIQKSLNWWLQKKPAAAIWMHIIDKFHLHSENAPKSMHLHLSSIKDTRFLGVAIYNLTSYFPYNFPFKGWDMFLSDNTWTKANTFPWAMQENNQVSLISSFRPSVYQAHFLKFLLLSLLLLLSSLLLLSLNSCTN